MQHEPISPAQVDAQFQRVSDRVTAWMGELHVPGVALGVLDGDQAHVAGLGITSVENTLPVTPETLFLTGSVTKVYTAVAIMRLVEQGRLDPDRPVRAYLPDLQLADDATARQVTLRHLLSHTAGWGSGDLGEPGPGDDALATALTNLRTLPQLTPVGTLFNNNNAHFILAGRVLEVVAGKPYETVIHEQIFQPLGMTRSFFFARDAITYRCAVGHTLVDGTLAVMRPWKFFQRWGNPAGGIVSCVTDQLRLLQCWLNSGRTPSGDPLLEPATLTAMLTPQVRTTMFADAWGIGWGLKTIGGAQVAFHPGLVPGQTAFCALVPQQAFAFLILTNAFSGPDSGGQLMIELGRLLLAEYRSLTEADIVPAALTPEELQAYVGRYVAATGGEAIELALQMGGLVLRMGAADGTATAPGFPLTFTAANQFVVRDAPQGRMVPWGDRGDVVRNPDGRIAWLRFFGQLYRPQAGTDALPSRSDTV